MKKVEYDCIERHLESGMRVYLVFPKRAGSNDAKMAQEVKEILSGALKESLERADGKE